MKADQRHFDKGAARFGGRGPVVECRWRWARDEAKALALLAHRSKRRKRLAQPPPDLPR